MTEIVTGCQVYRNPMLEPNSRSIVFVDMDHTVFDSAWRDELIGGEEGWDHYHTMSVHDEPQTDIVRLLLALKSAGGFELVGLTARPQKWRRLTADCLFRHGIPIDVLVMRDDDDYRKAPELKISLAEEYTDGQLDRIAFLMDDREDVAAAFKARGVTVLQVHGRKYGK